MTNTNKFGIPNEAREIDIPETPVYSNIIHIHRNIFTLHQLHSNMIYKKYRNIFTLYIM